MNIIEAKNIHRKFGSGELITHVLKGIDIQIKDGEFVAIMGKSGAGKSTLMYQLSALDEPTDGEILIDETDIIGMKENERTAFRLNTLGYVFQDYALVPDLSARENVMMPLLMRGITWAEASKTADESLDNVGLKDKYLNLPGMLSGGEQQRVAIARAIAGKPKIIFADEPTANLDSISGKQIIDLLTCLHKDSGQTIVMVTHEPEYAKNCDRIINMEDGLIVDEKNPWINRY
ncbi:ABC transporter ATP-binding protein [Candidatus Kaiserbacteria bacterium]|nr:ABC transporter ATP-binding protein [Candidatus Kaiserbacteria bacterium]